MLRQLGLLCRLAPELGGLLERPSPSGLELEEGPLLNLLRHRSTLLDEAGFALLLPSWWRDGQRLGLRAKASHRDSTNAPGGEGGGLNLQAIVAFQWQAVLGISPSPGPSWSGCSGPPRPSAPWSDCGASGP